jgi:hypothetical protein
MIVRLSWPDKLLWPNGGQGNRFAVSTAKKKAKNEASWAAIEARQTFGAFTHDGGEIPVRLVVHAKPKGPLPDKDNCVAAVKVQLDAIAREIGVNDRHFAAPVVEFSATRIGAMEVCLG